jgi:tRNA(Ile2) C34 agmatinyltransferase TiaS
MSIPRCPECFGRSQNTGVFGDSVTYHCRDCGTDWSLPRRDTPQPPHRRAHKRRAAMLARCAPARKG